MIRLLLRHPILFTAVYLRLKIARLGDWLNEINGRYR